MSVYAIHQHKIENNKKTRGENQLILIVHVPVYYVPVPFNIIRKEGCISTIICIVNTPRYRNVYVEDFHITSNVTPYISLFIFDNMWTRTSHTTCKLYRNRVCVTF